MFLAGRCLSRILSIAALGFAAGLQAQESIAALNFDRLADRIVSALKLKSGERVLVRTDPKLFAPIVAPLQRRVTAAGGKVLQPIPVEQTLTAPLLEAADVFVELPVSSSGRQLTTSELAILSAWTATGGARRELHFHWSEGTRNPDGTTAAHLPEWDRLYERALDIDYGAISAAQDRAIEVLRLGSARINTPAGTDLFFRVGARPFNKQNGDASAERARAARIAVDRAIELPAGVLRVAPVEESVFGQIALPEARFGDTVAKGVVIQIDNGRITRIRAKEGQEAVEKAIAAGGEGATWFREFALGFNPVLAEGAGPLIPYYGYGAGVVRLALGNNEELGGKVRGEFVRWFFLRDATVHVDFRYLVRDGKLVEAEAR